MASRSISRPIQDIMGGLIALEAEGFFYRNAQLVKKREELLINLNPKDDKFWNVGNNKIHIYHDRFLEEEANVFRVENIHQGAMYSARDATGGFYLGMHFFVREDGNVDAEIGYFKIFTIKEELRTPSLAFKSSYRRVLYVLKKTK